MNHVIKRIVYLLFAVLVLTQIYPLFWLLTYSLKTNEEIIGSSFFALPHISNMA